MEDQKTTIPTWYWVVAIILLLWNLMGVGSFFIHTFISDEVMEALPAAEQELYNSYPLWTKIIFAVAVFGGLIGSIGLVIKKKWTKAAFIVSLAAIIPQMIHNMFFTNSYEVYGTETYVMPVMVIVIGIFLVWFSAFAIKKDWLK